jgi:Co/Zn/Cd efflux system component
MKECLVVRSLPPSWREPQLGAFFSARHDVLAKIIIIPAGLITGYTLSVWPDLIIGLGIAP